MANKQSSIEWLIDAIESLEENRIRRIISIDEYDDNLEFVKEKAKQMHKEEIIEAFIGHDSDTEENIDVAEQYYQETI